MSQLRVHQNLKIRLLVWLGLLSTIASPPAIAQITPDATLGGENSRVTENVRVRGATGDRIDGGAIRGSNLFHSFSEFNVNEGQRVYFTNPSGISNILGRVTGTDVSDIMGTLGVDGNADLFLLNPNGIIFGPNARLDISGSFFASTGDRIAFPDGTRFSASNPGDSTLLSVNVPLGVQYGSTRPGPIANAGTLTVGRNLRLSGGSVASTGLLAAPSGQLRVEGVAGNVQVRQAAAQTATFSASNNLILRESQLQTVGNMNLLAGNTVQIRDSVVNPFIAYAGRNLTVQGNQNVDIFALNHPSSGLASGRDTVLRSANTVGGDAHYWTGGSFRIEQLDGRLGNLYSPYDPIIRSRGDVSFNAYIGNSLHILAAGDVNVPNFIQLFGQAGPGEVAIDDPGFVLSNGEPFPINGSREPTLDIRAGVDPAVIGLRQLPNTGNFFNTLISTPPPVDSANINIGTIILGGVAAENLPPSYLQGRILLTNRYEPDPNNLVPGNISIFDTQVNLANNPDLNGVAIRAETPNGGGIIALDSRGDINIRGRINANAVPSPTYTANGGDVTLLSRGTITFSSSTNTPTGGVNSIGIAGGDITLRALGNINLLQNVQILARNIAGAGNAGRIDISAGDTVTISAGSDPSVVTDVAGGTGNGNDLTITARLIEINNNSIVAASILAGGASTARAGNINIRATEQVSISGNSVVFSEIGSSGTGTGGTVSISAPTILLDNSSVNTQIRRGGRGQAGNIQISAPQLLQITNGGQISSITFGQGSAGDVTINSQNVRMNGGGTTSWSRNTFIRRNNQQPFEVFDQSGVFASVELGAIGNAGNVIINTPRLTLQDGAIISAQTLGAGQGGGILLQPYQDGRSLTVNLSRGSEISASTNSSGDGGNLEIAAPDSVTLTGGGSLTVESNLGATGSAGELSISTRSLTVDRGTQVSAQTFSSGSGGNILLRPYRNGRSLTIDISRDSEISASTNAGGRGGEVRINAPRSVTLRGGGRVAAESTGTGGAGDLRIFTGTLTIQDGTAVTVNRGSGNTPVAVSSRSRNINTNNQTGNLGITANFIDLNNGQLTAIARSGQGGNIRIQARNPEQEPFLLLMRNNSLISAQAFNNALGGNVLINDNTEFGVNNTILSSNTIDPIGFVLANQENNDIVASAVGNNGGNIRINAFGIFGLEERNPRIDTLSDINASSEFGTDGTIALNTLNIDPTRGLGELPVEIVNASDLVAEGCIGSNRAGVESQGEFTRTGRGGQSPNPSGTLADTSSIDQLATLDEVESGSATSAPSDDQPRALTEAQGLVLDAAGKVSLVPGPSTSPSNSSGLAPTLCNVQ